MDRSTSIPNMVSESDVIKVDKNLKNEISYLKTSCYDIRHYLDVVNDMIEDLKKNINTESFASNIKEVEEKIDKLDAYYNELIYYSTSLSSDSIITKISGKDVGEMNV